MKNGFCITNVLFHLLFCSSSPNTISQCRLCSRLFVKNANDFVSSFKYHFSQIFGNRFSFKEVESFFVQERKTFKLDNLFSSEKYDELVNCMSFFVSKNPTDVDIVLSEVYVRILTTILYSIASNILQMKGEHVLSTRLVFGLFY